MKPKMPRLRLELPETTVFSAELAVRVTDLNYGNHLGNDALLGLLHEARLAWFCAQGYQDERDLGGAGVILADAAIVFQSEAFLGETLRIELRVGEISRASFDLYYAVIAKEDGRPVAAAKTAIVFFDYDKRRSVAMPTAFRELLAIAGQTK
ncbi:MAG: esterase [Proteobacteria bacterium]|nr:esterase [Pseudomonadota bacterium]